MDGQRRRLMRLPVRHNPPGQDAPLRRCAHLDALCEAAVGLPLGPAARALTTARSRGRFGNALQWHLGLEPHDGRPELDWEDRIELKLVTVWRRLDGRVVSDKLKVCDATIDPGHKLSNVRFILVDRLTRVVLGSVHTHFAGTFAEVLREEWFRDPHFERPTLFVEARESGGGSAPAYYLSAEFLRRTGIVGDVPGTSHFDTKLLTEIRRETGRGPWLALAPERPEGEVPCPRCQGRLRFDPEQVEVRGFARAVHTMPLGDACATRAHLVVRPSADLPAAPVATPAELRDGLQGVGGLFRLCERVLEPEDHEH